MQFIAVEVFIFLFIHISLESSVCVKDMTCVRIVVHELEPKKMAVWFQCLDKTY